jgi:hypothetical protein
MCLFDVMVLPTMIAIKRLSETDIPIADERTLMRDVANFRCRRSSTSGWCNAAMSLVRTGHDVVAVAHVGDQIAIVRRALLIETVAPDAPANGSVIVASSRHGELWAAMPSPSLSFGVGRTDLLPGAAP